MLEVISFQDWRKMEDQSGIFIETVSKSKEWNGLSPFLLGPCELWGGHVSKNVENGWQFSKAYPEHLEDDGSVGRKWLDWAKSGWEDPIPHRYPMGKGAIPLFSIWDGRRLSYVEARKAIYVPLYSLAVSKSGAWGRLVDVAGMAEADDRNLYLVDYDAYRHKQEGMTYLDVVNNPQRKCGHAFVLGMMLEAQDELSKILEDGTRLRGKHE